MSQPARVTPINTQNPDAAGVQRRHNEGHGRRLTAAFEALENFPALAESRDRLLRLVTAERVSPGDVVAAVESDVALVIAVLRLANQVEGRNALKLAREALDPVEPFTVDAIEPRLKDVIDRLGVKPRDVYQPIRVALAGTTVSPGIFETLEVLGRDEALRRIDGALAT